MSEKPWPYLLGLCRLACLACCCAICLQTPCTAAAAERELEYQIKAAYLYKFAGHIEWPSNTFTDAAMPLTIGVLAADELAAELGRLKRGRLVNDRPVQVRVLKAGEPLQGVQLLFVGQLDERQLRRTLDAIQTQAVLAVTELPGALDAGSMINFVLLDKRVRFEISLAHAERSGLKVSAKLLAVAQRVDTGRP